MKRFLSFFILFLMTIFFNGCGWGWFVPYNLQPSYHKFKKMCKLNELPNNEEKYNKILSYFDLSLDTLDWEELNKGTWKIKETNGRYKKGIFEYRTATGWKYKNSRIEMEIDFLSNESRINRYNAKVMLFTVVWHTKRYVLSGNEGSGFYWSEETLGCLRYNMNPKE